MEEEKLSGRHSTLWAFLGLSHFYKHFLGKFFTGKGTIPLGNLGFTQHHFVRNLHELKQKTRLSSAGFTLVELLIVISVLGVLIILSLAVLNPVAQIQKAKDATRQNDLNQLYTALDTYYNDKGCYPTALSQLAPTPPVLAGTPIYIKNIPKDPDTSSGVNYNYFVDLANQCPQWFTIITKGYKTSGSSSTCSLETLNTPSNDCLPINYESGYNTCKISGTVDTVVCASIAGEELPLLQSSGSSSCSKDYACIGSPIHCSQMGDIGDNQGEYCNRNCDGVCQ